MREDSGTKADAALEPGADHSKRSTPGGAATEVGTLKFDLLRSALYHDLRETKLKRVHRILVFANLLAGSGAIAAFGYQFPVVGQVAGVFVAAISSAQLVWDYAGAARDHADMRRRFYGLLADTECPAEEIPVLDLRSRMVLIYADEPPMVRKTNEIAHDQAGEALFGDDFSRLRPKKERRGIFLRGR
ncbi:hypothetical protein GCM10011415_28390 [Salipiger pallidus]|uniref:Uncharacterized protein n=1 Tax=Salipiger pallidus TaxID=1775170 RepID=A0A8J3EH49_9RHOB|nr:hypothetical protein [Salipiger pallidus]GGG77803.1 hypothetical protein GCM10011415_28390 [Salipiger pallidus]